MTKEELIQTIDSVKREISTSDLTFAQRSEVVKSLNNIELDLIAGRTKWAEKRVYGLLTRIKRIRLWNN